MEFLSFKRRDQYFDLTRKYIEQKVSPEEFKIVLTGMRHQDFNVSKIIVMNFEHSEAFFIYDKSIEAIKFSLLIQNMYEVCIAVKKFNTKKGTSYLDFFNSVEKVYFLMQEFLEE